MTIGQSLGPYRILGKVGEGGMGEVYRGRDPRIGRDVAIKFLPSSVASDPDRLHRFEQEIRATGLLNHPNILTIYDTGTAALGDGTPTPFIVMELLEGRALRDAIRRGEIDAPRAIDYAIQVARGLAAAHRKGIVHRDLKPENLFVYDSARVKILDFGLAKLAAAVEPEGETRLQTQWGAVLGTMDYMSPEQARGEPVDHRSDLFAVGLILYEMLAGRVPFNGRTTAERVGALLRDEPGPLPAHALDVLPGVDRVIGRCLEKSPALRYQSAEDLAADLERLRAGALRDAPPRTSRQARRAWPVIIAMSGVLLVAGAIAASWLLRAPSSAQPGAGPFSAARVTPFLASDAIETDPAWSPTGNLIAYVSDVGGNADIWVCDPSGSNPINLTAAFAGADRIPAWSPDGQRLAFFSERGGGGIYTMAAFGGDVRLVLPVKPGVLCAFSLTWARDGSLVFTNFDDEGQKHLYSVPASGGEAACLTCRVEGSHGGRSGELSHSGELLLFKSSEIGARGPIFVLDRPSGRVTQVVDQADMPRWSADGSRIVFISSRDGTSDLWHVEVDAAGAPRGEPERLTSGLLVSAFAIAPDGDQILAVTQRAHAQLWSFPGSAERIDDLTVGEQWTSGQFRDWRPRWLPDGGVVFQSNRRGSLDIWTVASPGVTPARLTTGAGTEHRPRVSPDGQWIAFDLIDGTGEHVHVMRRDGSGVRLPDERWRTQFSMTCCAAWSPDGTHLAMHVDGSRSAIARLDPATGAAIETQPLDLPGGADEYHRWSPDGRLLVYEAVTEQSWDLWVADADGSNAHRLTSLPGNERAAAWHPRLPLVYFVGDDRAIWRIPVNGNGRATGEPRRWLTLTGRMEAETDSLDFSPDGSRLITSVIERAADIWLVERRPEAR